MLCWSLYWAQFHSLICTQSDSFADRLQNIGSETAPANVAFFCGPPQRTFPSRNQILTGWGQATFLRGGQKKWIDFEPKCPDFFARSPLCVLRTNVVGCDGASAPVAAETVFLNIFNLPFEDFELNSSLVTARGR